MVEVAVGVGGDASGAVVTELAAAFDPQFVAGDAPVGVEAAAVGQAVAERPGLGGAEGLVLDAAEQGDAVVVQFGDQAAVVADGDGLPGRVADGPGVAAEAVAVAQGQCQGARLEGFEYYFNRA